DRYRRYFTNESTSDGSNSEIGNENYSPTTISSPNFSFTTPITNNFGVNLTNGHFNLPEFLDQPSVPTSNNDVGLPSIDSLNQSGLQNQPSTSSPDNFAIDLSTHSRFGQNTSTLSRIKVTYANNYVESLRTRSNAERLESLYSFIDQGNSDNDSMNGDNSMHLHPNFNSENLQNQSPSDGSNSQDQNANQRQNTFPTNLLPVDLTDEQLRIVADLLNFRNADGRPVSLRDLIAEFRLRR
ncbi:hypothetical protein ACTXT7_016067, partial [Hymenolepis weldensis]